jgi:hypothetical protein
VTALGDGALPVGEKPMRLLATVVAAAATISPLAARRTERLSDMAIGPLGQRPSG